MNARTYSAPLAAAIALTASLAFSPASADLTIVPAPEKTVTETSENLQHVQFALRGASHITVTISGSTAILSGYGDSSSRSAAERAIQSHPLISKVVNLVLTQS